MASITGSIDDCLGPHFFDSLFNYFPVLGEQYTVPDASARADTELARLFMALALELQQAGGAEGLGIGEVRPGASAGLYDVAFEYEEEQTGGAAARLALALINHLLPGGQKPDKRTRLDFARTRNDFIRTARGRALNVQARYIVKAAAARDIPWVHLGGGLILFGQGRFQKRRLKQFNDRTSHISFAISSDKSATNRLLGELGLPVPAQRVVGNAKEAVRAADAIGYPVVVKPLNSDFGRGVSVRMADAEQVTAAHGRASRYARAVIVESFIEGEDFRLLVVDGKMVAAAKRIPAHVVGDGIHTIEELTDEINRDPRREPDGATWMRPLALDEEAERLLGEAGYKRSSIPDPGATVYLRRIANIVAGGTSIDVTDQVHPDNRRMAEWAARAIGIDVAGIDFITTDITRSYKEIGGGICEVNTTPALAPHVAAEGNPRDIAGPVLDALYPPGAPARIPVAVVTGTAGTASTARLLAHILSHAGHAVGLSTPAGVYIDGDLIHDGTLPRPAAARMILRNPTVDAAILEISPGDLLRHGLSFDGCDIAAVLNVTTDPADGSSTDSPEDLVEAVGVIIKATRDTVVINADDELCLGMAAHAEPGRILLATETDENKRVKAHLRQGLRGVVLRSNGNGKEIAIHHNRDHDPVAQIDLMTAMGEDGKTDHLQGAMFAIAMASALGHSAEHIQDALNSFEFISR